MAITFPQAILLTIVDYIVDKLDGGATAGYVTICESDNTVLATISFADPAFGAAANIDGTYGGATMDNDPHCKDTSADASGTAAKARFYDSDATLLWECTVGESGADITISDASITSGQTVEFTEAMVIRMAYAGS